MMRNAWFQDNIPVKVGVMGACPDGEGFRINLSDFQVRHLPDMRRAKWLEQNQ